MKHDPRLLHELQQLAPEQLVNRFMISAAQHGPGVNGFVIQGESPQDLELMAMKDDLLQRMGRKAVPVA